MFSTRLNAYIIIGIRDKTGDQYSISVDGSVEVDCVSAAKSQISYVHVGYC